MQQEVNHEEVNHERVILAVGRSGKKNKPEVTGSTPDIEYSNIQSNMAELDTYTLKNLRCVGFWSWFWLLCFGLNLIGLFVLNFNPEWLAPVEQTHGAVRYFLTVFLFNFIFIFKGTITTIVLLMFTYNRMAYYNTAVEVQDANGLLNSIYYKKYESPAYDARTGKAYQSLGVLDVLQQFKQFLGPMTYLLFTIVATVIALGYTGFYLYNVLIGDVPLSIADTFLMVFVSYEGVFIARYLYSALKVRIIES